MPTPSDEIAVRHVEHDRAFAELTATYPERENDRSTIETVERAEDGLERFDREEFDCFVSDCDMPGRTGIRFLGTGRDETESTPFIPFTGKGSEEVAGEAIAAGVTDLLLKGTGTEIYPLLATRITKAVEQYPSKEIGEKPQERYRTLVENSPNPIAVHRDELVFADEATVELLVRLFGDHEIDEVTETVPPDTDLRPIEGGNFPGTREVPAGWQAAQQPTFAPGILLVESDGGGPWETYAEELPPVVAAIQQIPTSRAAITAPAQSLLETRRYSRRLTGQQQLTERVFDTSPLGRIVLNPDGEIVGANDRAEDVLGLERPKLRSRTYEAPE